MTTMGVQWCPVEHLILGENPELRVYAEVSVWYQKLARFRRGEDERMFQAAPTPEDLAMHRRLLQRLITDGEHLLSLTRQIGLPDNPEGIKPEDLVATVETLQDAYRGWHEPMPPDRRRQLLQQVFPDVA